MTAIQGGTLSGDGAVVGNIQNTGGFVNPFAAGNPATLTDTGSYTQGPGGTLTIDLGGTAPGQFSVLDVSGVAALTGTVDFTTVNGFTPIPGDSFTFMEFASSTGNFSSMDLTNWACPTTCTDVFAPTSLTLVIGPGVSPVPEPSTLVLFGTSLLGLCGYMRRRYRGA